MSTEQKIDQILELIKSINIDIKDIILCYTSK